jgi:hypothetical protein
MKHVEDTIEAINLDQKTESGRMDYLRMALRALVLGLIAHREAIDKSRHGVKIRILSMSDIEALRPRSQVDGDPIDWAFKRAIRAIGKELDSAGGFKAMDLACDRMWDECGGHGVSIVDSAFDGVGEWHS